mgnify:FL=1
MFLGQAPDRTVHIEGHTDSRGSQSLNQTLSQQRADAVAQYLISRGIAPSRITTVGMGYGKPIADNKTAAGRQANRRVELTIKGGTQ